MAYVLVRNNKVVKTIDGLRSLTTAESANGGTRRQVNTGVIIYVDGTVTISNGKVSAITNPDALSTVEERRLEVKEWLRRAEQLPVSNWGLSDVPASGSTGARFSSLMANARGYWWWLEMIGNASSTDANLSTTARWNRIKAEMAWSLTDWYSEKASGFSFRNANTWYNTPASGTSFTTASDGMVMKQGSAWEGLVSYIH